MKRQITLILFIFMAAAAFAAGNNEDVKTWTFISEELPYEAGLSIQVEPSADITAVFSGNDDDGHFEEAEPFLYAGAERWRMSKDVVLYIEDIVKNDVDDIQSLVMDELKAAMEEKNADEAYMILGNMKLTCRRDYQ